MKNPRILLISVTFFCLFIPITTFAQKWLQGRYTDKKGNTETGMIWLKPPGKGPIPGEAFIEFKHDDKEQPYKLSASELRSMVIGRDSFAVAAEPQTGDWQYSVDFVKVVLNEDVNLYVFRGYVNNPNSGIQPEVDAGVGAGVGGGGYGYGGGVGIGLTIPIGHSGSNRTIYYYGENTARMYQLTNANFEDIMSNIMGDEPDVVEAIREKKYDLGNIDKLIAYFNKVVASHTGN